MELDLHDTKQSLQELQKDYHVRTCWTCQQLSRSPLYWVVATTNCELIGLYACTRIIMLPLFGHHGCKIHETYGRHVEKSTCSINSRDNAVS